LDIIHFAIFDSSLGNMLLVSRGKRLSELDISKESDYKIRKAFLAHYPDALESIEPFSKVNILLDRYLKGQRVDFDVDVDISHMGIFTRKVLLETRKIPYGEVRSYKWIGRRLGYKNAAQAVGQALKRNPIPIIIPCHRVIREDGTLGGFSMGLRIKEKLLALEGIKYSEW